MRRIHSHKGPPRALSLSATSSTERANNWPSHRPFVPVNLHIYLPSHLSLLHFLWILLSKHWIFSPLSLLRFYSFLLNSILLYSIWAHYNTHSLKVNLNLSGRSISEFLLSLSKARSVRCVCVCVCMFAFLPCTNTQKDTCSYSPLCFTPHTHTHRADFLAAD